MTVTSRRGVCRIQYVLVSTSENQTRVCVDTNSYTIFTFWLRHVESMYPHNFAWLKIWRYANSGEQHCLVLRLFLAWFIEQQSKVFLSGFTRINPTAPLIAHIPISNSRYNYCGSIPLARALGINIRVFGAEAVLFWNCHWIFEACTLLE